MCARSSPGTGREALASHGLQRMTARVLAALLFTEQPTMTMAELADQLQASSGAISGAIKMLTSVGLAERVPAPASRRDHYRLRDDAWALLFTNQNADLSHAGSRRNGDRRHRTRQPGRRRLIQMRDFYAFPPPRNPGAARPLASSVAAPVARHLIGHWSSAPTDCTPIAPADVRGPPPTSNIVV